MASRSSLGVVIPCHKPYIPLLKECLDSIEAQTDKPDYVIVMCSSSLPEDIPESYRSYSFPLEIVTRENVYNQGENRNEGIKRMKTDIVSFFDADDVMHPQRIELIRKYMVNCGILLHGFTTNSPAFETINAPRVHHNALIRGWTGCVLFDPKQEVKRYNETGEFDGDYVEWKKPLHHAHVSVRRDLLDFIKFPENSELVRREDSLFCGMIVSMRHIDNVFIEEDLSWYRLRG